MNVAILEACSSKLIDFLNKHRADVILVQNKDTNLLFRLVKLVDFLLTFSEKLQSDSHCIVCFNLVNLFLRKLGDINVLLLIYLS